jgi:hypothetical protein
MVQVDERRELTAEEIANYTQAQQKWYPAFISTFNTPLHELMASPLKYGLLRTVIFMAIGIIVYYFFNGGKLNMPKMTNFMKLAGLFTFLLFVGTTYISQYKTNQNILMVASLLPPNPTKYDYESSSVVQAQLMRNSIGAAGIRAGDSSGLLGGVIGGLIGSSRASRK